MKKLLKIPSTWTPIWIIAILMLCMISIYLPVFGSTSPRLTDFPLIIVDEDEGVSSFITGKEIADHLIKKQDGHTFSWKVAANKEAAIQELKNNQAYGALVIPTDYSKEIIELRDALITGKTEVKPAHLELLINEGGGRTTTMIATNALETLVTTASTTISGHLKEELIHNNSQLSPQNAILLANPIQYTLTNALGLPERTNNGMTPFMIVLITSISGIMGVNMINGYLKTSSAGIKSNGYPLRKTDVMSTSMLLGVLLSALVAAVLQIAIFGVFGSSHSTSIWLIFLFTFLCCLTMHFQFKMISLFLGKWGMLVMFPINILGIFSSGGAVPIATLPFIHHFFSNFLPARYMVDGLRVMLYYNGRIQAGLGVALFIILVYFVIFFGICLVVAYRVHRQELAKR
ncbi:ABC transporter permease [Sporosarcina sp. ACRSM]|uniref:YhgE/Pip domain-containing protein n=1 Tax=Sporosarcina sp. ACRSM TaxID=2918216 RepID=UPI001EF5CDA7|nr:ABC transporter permease [Sporosarcina sp. ACRSM]MCG7334652.1 ABC transporter permease [Sporosarcina sp. ACRSM]